MNGTTYYPLALKNAPIQGPTVQQWHPAVKLAPPDGRWWPPYDVPREVTKWAHPGPVKLQTLSEKKVLDPPDARWFPPYIRDVNRDLTQWPHKGPINVQVKSEQRGPLEGPDKRWWPPYDVPREVTKWPHLGLTVLPTFPLALLDTKAWPQPAYPPADLFKGFLHSTTVVVQPLTPYLLDKLDTRYTVSWPIPDVAKWAHLGPVNLQIGSERQVLPGPDNRWWPPRDVPRDLTQWPHIGPTNLQSFAVHLLRRGHGTGVTGITYYPIAAKWGPPAGATVQQTFPPKLQDPPAWPAPTYPPSDVKGFIHSSTVVVPQLIPPVLLDTKPYIWLPYPPADLVKWPHLGPVNLQIGSERKVLDIADPRWFVPRDVNRDLTQWPHLGPTSLQSIPPIPLLETKPYIWAPYPIAELVKWPHVGPTNLQTFPVKLLESPPWPQPTYPIAELKGYLHTLVVTVAQTYPALLEAKPYIWTPYPKAEIITWPHRAPVNLQVGSERKVLDPPASQWWPARDVPRDLLQGFAHQPTPQQTSPIPLLETKPYVWAPYPIAELIKWPHRGPVNLQIGSEKGPLEGPARQWWPPYDVPRNLTQWQHLGASILQTHPIKLLESPPWPGPQYQIATLTPYFHVLIPPTTTQAVLKGFVVIGGQVTGAVTVSPTTGLITFSQVIGALTISPTTGLVTFSPVIGITGGV